MDPALKTEANRVRGCVSQVWVHAEPEDGSARVRFHADSDAQLTKGLAALLVLGLSGAPTGDVARVPVDFIELLGIKQSLSPSRNSGLLNMLSLMKRKALEVPVTQGLASDPYKKRLLNRVVEREPEFAAFNVQEEAKSEVEIEKPVNVQEEVKVWTGFTVFR
jgi:BolA-like protein 1